MKKLIVLVSLFLLSFYMFSQVNPDAAFKLICEECGPDTFYKDIISTNVDGQMWSAVGTYQTEKAFYYSYDTYHGYTLSMISDDNKISAMHYTKYFIYDDFQNLTYFVYQGLYVGELIIKYNGQEYEIISKSDDATLEENYFLYPESDFNPDSIRVEAQKNLSYCDILFGMPVYKEQTDYIRKRFKEVNSMNNLIERESGDYIGYYNGNELVKIVAKLDSNREYYLDNGKLIFAYYPATSYSEDIRVYFYNGSAYQVILGKEYMPKSGEDFHEYNFQVKDDFESIIEVL